MVWLIKSILAFVLGYITLCRGDDQLSSNTSYYFQATRESEIVTFREYIRDKINRVIYIVPKVMNMETHDNDGITGYAWAVVNKQRGTPLLTLPYNYWLLSLGTMKVGSYEMDMELVLLPNYTKCTDNFNDFTNRTICTNCYGTYCTKCTTTCTTCTNSTNCTNSTTCTNSTSGANSTNCTNCTSSCYSTNYTDALSTNDKIYIMTQFLWNLTLANANLDTSDPATTQMVCFKNEPQFSLLNMFECMDIDDSHENYRFNAVDKETIINVLYITQLVLTVLLAFTWPFLITGLGHFMKHDKNRTTTDDENEDYESSILL